MTALNLPTGTITFLFSDIEGSTLLLERLGRGGFKDALDTHNEIMRRAVGEGGTVVRTIGDAFFVVFSDPSVAVSAAAEAQRALAEATWPKDGAIRVRMGLHTGTAVLGGDDYVGLDVHRAARVADAGHGGQIVLSATTAGLVDERLPTDLTVRSLGQHRLKDLSEPVPLYQLDVHGLGSEFPPLRTIDVVAGNLPVQPTSFVGRSKELVAIADLLEQRRVVTLTGPGGTGKTRLATQVAAEVGDRFRDGAFFVSLEAITDPDLIPAAVLDSLGVTLATSVDPADHLAGVLGDKEALLVLDNLEQIRGAGAPVASMLAAAPAVKFIATSRAPLHISGEQEYPVPPLSMPDPETASTTEAISRSEGVALFTERALAVRPDFALTDDNVAIVAELTNRLDGLPLAIELAASRVKALTPDAILDRLDNRLLTSQADDLPERQRTIANAIGWSYDLFHESERRLFEDLSVFMGGATLGFAEHVATAEGDGVNVIDGLSALVDHSLLRLATTSGEPRYQMLVVVREFAYAALVARGDDDRLRRRHARAFADLAAEAAPWLLTSRRREWLDRLAAEHDNLGAAADWAAEVGDADLTLALVADLWRFWQARGFLDEAQQRIDVALAIDGGTPLARARALEAKGGIHYWRGLWAEALEPYEQALAILRAEGEPAEVANALYNASFPLAFSGDRARSRAYLEESLALAEAAGDRLGVGRAYWGISDLTTYGDDRHEAIRYALLAEEIFEGLDAPFDLGWARFVIAQSYFVLGDTSMARRYLIEGFRSFADAGDQTALVLALYLKAGILIVEGSPELAARLVGGVRHLIRQSGAAIGDVELAQYDEVRALVEDPGPEIQAAIEEGARLTLEELFELVVST